MATAKGPKPGTGKIKDKDTVVVNLAGVTAKARKTVHLPAGNYRAKVVKAETKTFKTGNSGVSWAYEIIEGKGKGSVFWNNTMLVESSIWAFRAALQALTPKVNIKDGAMSIPLSKLVGRTCVIELVDGEYEGKIRSEVNDVFHEDLLDEEDEVEEEEANESEEEWDEAEDEEDEDASADEEEPEENEEEDDDEIDLDEDEL